MDILYAVSEAFPFAKNGGLGDVAGAFPPELAKQGLNVRVILPLYDTIPVEYVERMEPIKNFTLQLALETFCCGLYRLEFGGVTWYFIENDRCFGRGRLYGCEDDDRRFAFFCMAVCESVRHLDWRPDIVHCNDWQTALIPFYMEDVYLRHPGLNPICTVFTIHNVEFQGNFDYHTLTDVFGLSGALFAEGTVELDGSVNLMKGAIERANCITTVSPSYARELTAPDAAGPLAEVIASHRVYGIRNGIPREDNPFDSRLTHRPYAADCVEEKVFNKLWMQEMHGLKVSEDVPVFGCVGRLLPRKGFDLLLEVLPEFLEQGAQLVVTGDGSGEIQTRLQSLKDRFPGQVALMRFSEQNAVEVFSSVDMLLMPSQVEPCGTAQMEAMRYGTVPVVRATGGLRDTVTPYTGPDSDGCGFVFEDYSAEAMRGAMTGAVAVYRNTEEWEALERRCMEQDFSWEAPAKEYVRLYQSLIGGK